LSVCLLFIKSGISAERKIRLRLHAKCRQFSLWFNVLNLQSYSERNTSVYFLY
jgi:hypothetical protein